MRDRTLRRLPFWIAVAVAAAAAAFALVLLVRDERPAPAGMPLGRDGVAAQASIRPRVSVFGDRVTARVDVLVDRERVDPDAITVAATFDPFDRAAPPRRTRVDYDRLTRLRIEYPLGCVAGICVPDAKTRDLDLAPAALERGGAKIATLEWPRVTIASRIGEVRGEQARQDRSSLGISGFPWRADTRLRPATYRVDAGALTALLAGAAMLLLVASLYFVGRAFPGSPLRLPRLRRRKLSPLERALVVLERANERGIEREQRLALDRLAQELRAGGAAELAGSARRLAWHPAVPASDRTAALAERVRELAARRTNGRP